MDASQLQVRGWGARDPGSVGGQRHGLAPGAAPQSQGLENQEPPLPDAGVTSQLSPPICTDTARERQSYLSSGTNPRKSPEHPFQKAKLFTGMFLWQFHSNNLFLEETLHTHVCMYS